MNRANRVLHRRDDGDGESISSLIHHPSVDVEHSPLRGDLSDEDLLAVTNARLSRIIAANADADRDVVVLKGTRTPPATPGTAKDADAGRKKDVGSHSDNTVADDADADLDAEEIAIAGRKTMPKLKDGTPSPRRQPQQRDHQVALQDKTKPKYPKTPPASSDGDGSGEDGNDPLIVAASSDPGEIAARQEIQSILTKAPIIIFSKSYCPYSRRAKQVLLHDYDIVPKPYVVELDQLTDPLPSKKKSKSKSKEKETASTKTTMGRKIQDLLKSLTGRSTVPNIMIASQSLGGSDEIVDLHNQGKLADTIRKLAGKRIVSVEPVDTTTATTTDGRGDEKKILKETKKKRKQ
ncbi:hypothetical protein DV737_g3751, partial [Chaetothyriales sp. CBS 132003]